MIKPSEIQRMFELVNGIPYWMPRPHSDFRTRYACKHWNERFPLTTFKDGDEIRIKGVGRAYSYDEVVQIMNTRIIESGSHHQKESSRTVARDQQRDTYKGKRCIKCSSNARFTETAKCVKCSKGKFILTADEARKRFKLVNGVVYWKDRPQSDFNNYQAYKTWKALCEGKPAGGVNGVMSMTILDQRITRNIHQLAKLIKPAT